MEKILKTILWTVVVVVSIMLIGQFIIWILPFVVVIGLGIYLYGKYKIKKIQEEVAKNQSGFSSGNFTSNNYSSNTYKQTTNTEEKVEVVDVEYKDAD